LALILIEERKKNNRIKSLKKNANREEVLETTVLAIKSGQAPFAAFLASKPDELPSDEDVKWVCNEMERLGHNHPIPCLNVSVNPLEDASLIEFLRDARRSPNTFHKATDFYSFAHKWATKRGWIPPQYRKAKNRANRRDVEDLIDLVERRAEQVEQEIMHGLSLEQLCEILTTAVLECRAPVVPKIYPLEPTLYQRCLDMDEECKWDEFRQLA
jgi:hypothetical protein